MATPVSPRNFFMRNNLFIGTEGDYAIKWDPKMVNCDIDYEGVGRGPFKSFLKFNGRFATVEEAREKAEGYRHVVIVTPAKAFASGVLPPENPGKSYPNDLDLRPSKESEVIDAGQILPGYNNGFAGIAPDIGALELGSQLPHYGPR